MVQLSLIELFESFQVNPYEILGIKRDASKDEVKKSLKKKWIK